VAKTNKIAKYLKAAQVAPPGVFREAHARPGLYLLELRSHVAVASTLHKRKLVITVNPEYGPDCLPKVVKITHV
jgi:hypothetical protein